VQSSALGGSYELLRLDRITTNFEEYILIGKALGIILKDFGPESSEDFS
jgi:hypothetical protein